MAEAFSYAANHEQMMMHVNDAGNDADDTLSTQQL
jgi:hypothetical protein